jgi:NAD(P)-dependent dehydrogenase (short-subunit alcohol dehydrogenase family)
MRLEGRAALVIGASGGIGRAIALAFAREGAHLALAARTEKALEGVGREVKGVGGRAAVFPTDVTDEAQVQRLVDGAQAALGRVDVLVTAAGVGAFAPVERSTLADWEWMMAANLRGTYLACRAILPVMRGQGGGTIINVLSLAAKRPIPECAAYCASKFGALGFTLVLAEEARPYGIRVGALCPGATDTPFWDTIPNAPGREGMLRPEQVAEAALLMATQPARTAVEEIVMGPAAGLL